MPWWITAPTVNPIAWLAWFCEIATPVSRSSSRNNTLVASVNGRWLVTTVGMAGGRPR